MNRKSLVAFISARCSLNAWWLISSGLRSKLRFGIDYKSVTGPDRLMVLVPLLVVITFGVTVVMVDVIRCLPEISSVLLLLLLLLLLFNRIADEPVLIVTTFLLSAGDVFVCKFFKRYSKLK